MDTFGHNNNNNNNPSLLDALTWTSIMPVKPLVQPSFIELFGELNFEENPNPNLNTSTTDPMSMSSPPSSYSFGFDIISKKHENGGLGNITDESSKGSSYHRKSDSMNSESLQLCTEGLGFESCADVEDLKNYDNSQGKSSVTKQWGSYYHSSELRRARAEAFPPPISSIGKSGKPTVCFRSFREDGRFVLREIRIPTQDFLHACREDGRLKLHFVHPNDQDHQDAQGEQACNAQENKHDSDQDEY